MAMLVLLHFSVAVLTWRLLVLVGCLCWIERCQEAPEDSHEYENPGGASHYAWMVPCIFPSAL